MMSSMANYQKMSGKMNDSTIVNDRKYNRNSSMDSQKLSLNDSLRFDAITNNMQVNVTSDTRMSDSMLNEDNIKTLRLS